MIKGIRAGMADRLVAVFGERTLEIIDKESARLEEVDGSGPGVIALPQDVSRKLKTTIMLPTAWSFLDVPTI